MARLSQSGCPEHNRTIETVVHRADFVVTANPVLDCRRGGSYSERSFLRAAVVSNPERADRVLVCFGRGSTAQDHKLVVQV